MGQAPRITAVDDGHEIAYRVVSEAEGPVILHTAGGTAPIEVLDEDPLYRRFLETLGGYGTLVRFDRPAIGASDPFDPERDLLAQTTEALVAVLDAVEADQGWLAIDGSTGAFLLTRVARDHQARLAGAAILNPPAPLPEHLAAPDVDTVVDRLVQRDQQAPSSGIRASSPTGPMIRPTWHGPSGPDAWAPPQPVPAPTGELSSGPPAASTPPPSKGRRRCS